MNTAVSSSVLSGRSPTAIRPLWIVVGALSVCALAMGATWMQVSSAAAPQAQTTAALTTASSASPKARPVTVAQVQALPAKPICANCGVVEAVTPFSRQGQGSGVGAVAGGVLGGVVGNQVGKGNGRAVATVLGAVGGGWAGHTIEKNMKKTTAYRVVLRMQDGSSRTLEQTSAPLVGSKVMVEGGVLKPA
jgi:outer membrane lipoprotein SlyB